MKRHLVVVGAGAIGLTIAWRASREGLAVTVIDRGPSGQGASWASAGMLPYLNLETARHPLDRFAAASHALHFAWSSELIAQSGIDYEIERNGTLHLASSRAEEAALLGLEQQARDEQIPTERMSEQAISSLISTASHVATAGSKIKGLFFSMDGQLRPPRFTRALVAACAKNGVQVVVNADNVSLTTRAGRIAAVQTANFGPFRADEFVVAAGTWSGELLEPVGVDTRFIPIRGQMVYYKLPSRAFASTIYDGGHYLVSRRDGGLLIGSTLEDVGFDSGTAPEALETLRQLGAKYLSEVASREPDQAWAGLRPGTFDGFPYIGRTAEYENLIVAAGHFRTGIQLAPATAEAVCDLLADRPSSHDLSAFRVSRG